MFRAWMLFLIVLVVPPAYAECPDIVWGTYPGWGERFSGTVSLGNSTSVESFTVEVTQVFDYGVKLYIRRDASDYTRTTLEVGDGILKMSDIMVKLHNISGNDAYLSIYTPHKANVTVNLTALDVFTTVSGRISLYPSEEFTAEFSLNNTGELEAKDLEIIPQFGDFEILYQDTKNITSICPGSESRIKYTLKAPTVRKTFNYTLYLKLRYTEENVQLNRVQQREKYYPIDVEIKPAIVTIERSTTNWTLSNPGREINVVVLINNTGSVPAENVEWSADFPPFAKVISGTTTWSGRLPEGQSRTFYYSLISDDPIMCSGVSKVTYEDTLGNMYASYSNNDTLRFSPFLSIEKHMNSLVWTIDPTRNLLYGNVTWSVNADSWWSNRSTKAVVNSPRKIWVNRTANITVKIKNKGNAVARDVAVWEVLDGVKVTSGTSSWNGTLYPGEEVSYNYSLMVLKHGNLTLKTNATYLDVDLDSFKPPLSIAGRPALRYCTTILEKVKFESKDSFYGLYPSLYLNQTGNITVLGTSEFEFNVTVYNNGSDAVRDVFVFIDTSDLRAPEYKYGGGILKGQSTYYQSELKPRYYPDGTNRSVEGTNLTYNLILRAPKVEEDRNFTLSTVVNYTDFFGETHTLNISTNITVTTVRPAYLIVTAEKKEVRFLVDYANETNIGDYAEAKLKIKSTGFSPLSNVTLLLQIPVGLEAYTNDTSWRGRIAAQLRLANETWYGLTGNITWNSSFSVGQERTLPFLMRGSRAGLYSIPYTIMYDGEKLEGSFNLTVKGAILRITKSLSEYEIYLGNETNVTLKVENIGVDTARNVVISDTPPQNFEIFGKTTLSLDELKPGEKAFLRYALKAKKKGIFELETASVSWVDRYGNDYSAKSEAKKVEVLEKPEELKPVEKVEKPKEEIKLSVKQIIITVLFSIIVLAIMLKILTFSKPISKR